MSDPEEDSWVPVVCILCEGARRSQYTGEPCRACEGAGGYLIRESDAATHGEAATVQDPLTWLASWGEYGEA